LTQGVTVKVTLKAGQSTISSGSFPANPIIHHNNRKGRDAVLGGPFAG
jgi:hypothetical protein